KSWALFGPPLGRTWHPTIEQRNNFPEIKPLVSNPWTLLHGEAPPQSDIVAVDVPTYKGGSQTESSKTAGKKGRLQTVPVWHGTTLPATDGDIWLATGFADYERYVAAAKAGDFGRLDFAPFLPGVDVRVDENVSLFPYRSGYLSAVRTNGDVALADIKSDVSNDDWYRIASNKGVLALHELRRIVGDLQFKSAMDSFGRKHAGQRVSTAQFQAHMQEVSGKSLAEFFNTWVRQTGLPSNYPKTAAYSVMTFFREQDRT